jgi:hypothetical protein
MLTDSERILLLLVAVSTCGALVMGLVCLFQSL